MTLLQGDKYILKEVSSNKKFQDFTIISGFTLGAVTAVNKMKKQFFRNSRSKDRKSNLGAITLHMLLGRSLGTATLIHSNSTCSFNRVYMKQKSYYLLERNKPILSWKVTGMSLLVPSFPCLQAGEQRGNTAGTTCPLAPAAAHKVPTAVLEH